jgi:quercetin dioxygenase-like cupin family protein
MPAEPHLSGMSDFELLEAAVSDLDPGDGEVATAELVVSDDALVKAFVLGPGASVDPHEHGESTNVFHVLRGAVTVERGEEERIVDAPGVVHHARGVVHGAHNETDETAVFTATLCPMP